MNVFFCVQNTILLVIAVTLPSKLAIFPPFYIRDHREGTKPARGRQHRGFVFSSLPSLPFFIEEKQTRFIESGVGGIKILHERTDKSTIRLN